MWYYIFCLQTLNYIKIIGIKESYVQSALFLDLRYINVIKLKTNDIIPF
jgi:hypothetical protein